MVEPRNKEHRSLLEILLVVRVQVYRRLTGQRPSDYQTGSLE
jgi:hypothetical protein